MKLGVEGEDLSYRKKKKTREREGGINTWGYLGGGGGCMSMYRTQWVSFS